MTNAEISERVNFCLKRVDIINKNSLYPSELSGGMQKEWPLQEYIHAA